MIGCSFNLQASTAGIIVNSSLKNKANWQHTAHAILANYATMGLE